jgi:hypothetical protein
LCCAFPHIYPIFCKVYKDFLTDIKELSISLQRPKRYLLCVGEESLH